MNLLTPLAGLILALAVIPPLLLLYFLKLRRRSQVISCTLLWKKSVEDIRANAPFQRLRKNLLLFLQLLALLFLILSIMQPQIQGGQVSGERTILLIDNSASMTATDVAGAENRLQLAKLRARDWVESVYTGGLFRGDPGETMVVAFSDRAEIVSRFTRSRSQLLSAIASIQPTHGETRIDQVLQLARAYTINPNPDIPRPIGPPSEMHLFSDGALADLADQVLRGERLTYHAIGTAEPDNVALTDIAIERPYDRPTAVEVFTAVANFNTYEVTCDLELAVNESIIGIQSVTISAATVDNESGELIPGRDNVLFSPFEQPRGAVISVTIPRPDDLMADNSLQQVVPPPKRLRVALVEPKSFIPRAALEGMELEQLVVLNAEQFERRAAEGQMEFFDVVMLDNYTPSQLPVGRYLSFGATLPLEGLNDFGEGRNLIILNIDENHPVLRYVNIDDIQVDRYRKLAPADDVRILAEGGEGPAIVEYSRSGVRAIHLTFDMLDSNMPFSRSIITFLFNAIEYLGQLGTGITTEGYAPGDTISERLPSSASNIRLMMPDGSSELLQPTDPTNTSWGPIRHSGLYLLSWDQPGTSERQMQPIAVNMRSGVEGNLKVVEEIQFGAEVIEGQMRGGQRYIPLWPYAVALCLAVLMLEWWMYHRKAVV